MTYRDNLNNKLSILQSANRSLLEIYPFPHLVIYDALPEELAKDLTDNFPISQDINDVNNARFDLSAKEVNEKKEISNLWKSFINFHTSKEFFDEVIEIFSIEILKNNSFQFSNKDNISKLRVGVRNIDSFKTRDILLDAQISINSPVTKKSAVREAHVDNTNKIFSGLLYLRQPHDDSSGGDLNLCKWKDDCSEKDKLRFYKEGLQKKHIELYKQIKYKNNVCIIFLNSLDALHEVTPREITQHYRTFVNLVGELPYDFFQKEKKIFKAIKQSKLLLKDLIKKK